MLAFIRGEMLSLRPLIIAFAAAGAAFCIAWTYKAGFEQGMLEAFRDEQAMIQEDVNMAVREMQAGREP